MRDIEELMKLDYEIALHRDEDGTYFATVNELPGCMADGDTPNEAVDNVREAMQLWMKSRADAGLEIPEPRDIASYSGKILVRMPRSLHKKLAAQAAAEGVSLNQHIVSTLSEASGATSSIGYQQAATQAGAYWGTALYLGMTQNALIGRVHGPQVDIAGVPGLLSTSQMFQGTQAGYAVEQKVLARTPGTGLAA